MTREPSNLAREAMDLAREADNKINAHEDLCFERYKHINDSLSRIMKILGWGGTTLATLIIGVLGWAMLELYSANQKAMTHLQEVESAAHRSIDR